MRLVPCLASEFHGHHVEGDMCPLCEDTPRAARAAYERKPRAQRLYEYMIANDESVITFDPWQNLPHVIQNEWDEEAAHRIGRVIHLGEHSAPWMAFEDLIVSGGS